MCTKLSCKGRSESSPPFHLHVGHVLPSQDRVRVRLTVLQRTYEHGQPLRDDGVEDCESILAAAHRRLFHVYFQKLNKKLAALIKKNLLATVRILVLRGFKIWFGVGLMEETGQSGTHRRCWQQNRRIAEAYYASEVRPPSVRVSAQEDAQVRGVFAVTGLPVVVL